MVSLLQNMFNESIGLTITAKKESGSENSNVVRGSAIGPSGSSINEKFKGNVFKLKNFFLVDAYSEQFIEYDGIRVLLNIVEITSGNTRVMIIINFK